LGGEKGNNGKYRKAGGKRRESQQEISMKERTKPQEKNEIGGIWGGPFLLKGGGVKQKKRRSLNRLLVKKHAGSKKPD